MRHSNDDNIMYQLSIINLNMLFSKKEHENVLEDVNDAYLKIYL